MSADGDGQPMLDQRVGALAEAVAARTPAPGAGAVTGLAAVLAAALAAMVARFSAADAAAAECDRLRRRLEPLGDEDAAAYEAYLAAIRLPRDDVHRSTRVVDTLSAATDVPMHLVELAAEVAAHAARLARDGNPRLRGDAVAAALLAAAAARTAAVLVAVNLDGQEAFRADPRPGRARVRAAEAQTLADGVAG